MFQAAWLPLRIEWLALEGYCVCRHSTEARIPQPLCDGLGRLNTNEFDRTPYSPFATPILVQRQVILGPAETNGEYIALPELDLLVLSAGFQLIKWDWVVSERVILVACELSIAAVI